LTTISTNPFVRPLCAALLAGAIGAVVVHLQLSVTQQLVAVCPCMMLVPGPHLLNGAIDPAHARIPDTKSGAQIRALGRAAISCLESAPGREGSQYLFPADWGDGHFIGVVRVLDRVCAKAKLKGVTSHVLRHTFASVAGDLGFSELTIAGLLGHSARGVTQGYVHLDTALVVAADSVSARIAELLDGAVVSTSREKGSRKGDGRWALSRAVNRS
jgi:hypothetical protein